MFRASLWHQPLQGFQERGLAERAPHFVCAHTPVPSRQLAKPRVTERLQQVADPLTLYERPVNRFVAGFVGSPPMNQVPGRLEGDGDLVFAGGGMRLALGPARGDLAGWRGREVVLGARPEDIRLAAAPGTPAGSGARPTASAASPEAPLRARVEVVEPLGSEVLIVALLGETALTVRLPSAKPPRVGDSLDLAFERERLHFFAADGGQALDARAG